MPPRSYNQACPFAFALDLIGERWTLLIVRDLLLGPLRFSDLLDRLPGIGRNLLALRLRRLQDEGLLERRELPAPSGSTVYALTEKGRGLEDGLLAFSAWGIRYGFAEDRLTGHLEPDLMGLAFGMAFDPGRAGAVSHVHELVISGTPLHVRVAGGRAEVRRGAATHPLVRLRAESAFFGVALQTRVVELAGALERGDLVVEGEASAVPGVLGLYGIAVR